ncbi:MAG: DNA-directed DNA polymerase II small subunit [Thermoplasmatota archaeon]
MLVQDLVREVGERGTLFDPSAVQFLSEPGAPIDVIAASLRASAELPWVLTREELGQHMGERGAARPTPPSAPAGDPMPEAAAHGLPEPERPPVASPREFSAPPPPQPWGTGPRPFAVAGAASASAVLLPPSAPASLVEAPVRPMTPEVAVAPIAVLVRPAPIAADIPPFDHRFEILADVTGESQCEGAITDFTRYFNDRLQKGRKLLRARRSMVGAINIKGVRGAGPREYRLIGLVSAVRKTKNGHRLIELEDETGSVPILAHANDPAKIAEAETVIEDEVIGVVAKPARNGELLILEEIVRPDVPTDRIRARSERDASVAFISDVHFGSKTFLADDWDRFVRFLTAAEDDSARRAQAMRIKYLVVNGDVVDGVGIFPGQEDELAVTDAYAQYDVAGKEFARIQAARPDLKIFLIPGNHDLVRPAEPQPAFQQKYRRLFPKEALFHGNPLRLKLEGVEILAYHGRSLDDWNVRIPGLTYERPIDAMRQMMQRRHLAPIYGLRTPIAPEHKDYMMIDSVPDVFATGHVHSAGIDVYRGTTLVNSSCWQSQTAYQKMHGFQPVPGRVVLYDLRAGVADMLSFHTGAAGVDRVGMSHLGKPQAGVDPGAVA